MKTKLFTLAACALPAALTAATIDLPPVPATATSPNPSVNGNLIIGLPPALGAYIDTVNAGTASSGAWNGSATGSTSIGVALVGGADLRTQTMLGTGAIDFNTITSYTGLLGNVLDALELTDIVGAGALIQSWEASVNLTGLGFVLNPSTAYALTFDLTQSTSLLGNLSPAVFNSFTVEVGDSSGVMPAGLLGITDIFGGSGTVTFEFTTGAVIDGDVIATFGATALADTNTNVQLLEALLGANGTSTLYSISGITLIPEPGTGVLALSCAGLLALRRRRPL